MELLGAPSLEKSESNISFLSRSLRKSEIGNAILFVFDNFETLRNPVDIYQWLDSNIRSPNKILITSRFRDFKGDYPIEVSGMERVEAMALIDGTARVLGIQGLLTDEYKDYIFDEADGHPYVMKIILGEVADTKQFGRPGKIIAKKDDILDAIFERTFLNLSPMAVRIFLTLSGWRSFVPQLALESVLLRDMAEQTDPRSGVDELVRMSLVQRTTAQDGSDFLDMPLAASLFGNKKLNVSPEKLLIENDIKLLQDLGPTNANSLKEGLAPRVRNLFRRILFKINEGNGKIEDTLPVLEFIAKSYPPAWLLLSDFYEEADLPSSLERSAHYVRRFLEIEPDAAESGAAWQRLAGLYRRSGDVVAACGAFARAFEAANAPLAEISDMAIWLNNQHGAIASMDPTDRATIFNSLARLMERKIGEASATDLSRLAWLHLHSGNATRARDVADLGLKREPTNVHCQRLVDRLAG